LGLPLQLSVIYGNAAHTFATSGLPHAAFRFLFLLISAVFRIIGGLLMAWQIVILIINGYLLF
jgi:hypothetical protein